MPMSTTRTRCLVVFSLLEILLFGGIIFGWSSLVFVLKAEGLFGDLCTDSVNISLVRLQASENITRHNVVSNCFQQDDRFNLIFSIAVAALYGTHILFGQMYYSLGTKKTRVIIIVLYVLGLFLLAIASPEQPWLVLPGITSIGIAGISMLLSDMQVAILLSKWSPIYLGMASGFFNSSVLTQRIVKELFERGVKRYYSFTAIAILMVGISSLTTYYFPSKGEAKSDVTDAKDSKAQNIEMILNKEINIAVVEEKQTTQVTNNNTEYSDTQFGGATSYKIENNSIETTSAEVARNIDDVPTKIMHVIISRNYILQVSWFSIMLLRLFHYLGSINSFMEQILDSKDQVSYFTDVMAYTMMGGCIASIFAGQLLHWENQCCSENFRKIFPLSLTSGLAVALSAMSFLKTDSALYGNFIILTIFRSFVFGINMDFIISAFPKKFVTVLYGLQCTIAGTISMLQYALFVWAEGYPGALKHVNCVLLGLSVLSFVQPVYLFIGAITTKSKNVGR